MGENLFVFSLVSYGHLAADLGRHENLVQELFQWGQSGDHIGVQAFAVDWCGDEREEGVLYQPCNGQAILVFTQNDSGGMEKPCVHEQDAYNIGSDF